jgi:hypothetical protein
MRGDDSIAAMTVPRCQLAARAARWIWFGVFAALLVVHHAGPRERLPWVLNASRPSRP